MKISVVINTYNREKHLSNTLNALRYQRHDDFEVIVVNGPSTDKTNDVLMAYNSLVKAVSCPVANLSISRNIGIENSTGEIVAFLDDDAIPEPTWLLRLEKAYHDPEVGGAGGFTRDHTGYDYQCQVVVCDRLGDSENFLNVQSANVLHRPGCDRYYSLTGCNSSFRRSALIEIGGFDEEYAYFLDETDVCLRIVDKGYKLKYVSDAQVLHKYAESHLRNQEKIPTSLYLSPKSKAYFCMKHLGQYDQDVVFARLLSYQTNLEKDKKWLFENNKITEEHYHQLLNDIDQGIKDGIAQAKRFPNGQHGIKQKQDKKISFKKFTPLKEEGKEKMRIALCSREYPPAVVGGIGLWTSEVAKGLAGKGHEVSVVSLSETGYATVDFIDGVWVHRIVPAWQPKRQSPKLEHLPQIAKDYCYSVYDEIMRIKAMRGLDLVSFPIWDVEGAACYSSGQIPSIMSLHTTYGLALPHKPDWYTNKEYKRGHVDKLIATEKELLNSDIKLLANSHAVVDDIKTTYGLEIDEERIEHVPHGLADMRKLYQLQPNVTNDEKKSEVIKILYVGRFETRKGIDILLDAIPNILEKHENVIFRLVGDNEIVENNKSHKDEFLKKYSSDHWLDKVEFVGKLSQEELLSEYANCDFFVAPSRYESFGLIYLEASMFEKASIAPEIGGAKEVIKHEENGLIFKNGDSNSLELAIEKLILNASLRKELGKKARRIYEELYSLEVMIGSIEKVYSSVKNEKRL